MQLSLLNGFLNAVELLQSHPEMGRPAGSWEHESSSSRALHMSSPIVCGVPGWSCSLSFMAARDGRQSCD
jgi:hypothetical protein